MLLRFSLMCHVLSDFSFLAELELKRGCVSRGTLSQFSRFVIERAFDWFVSLVGLLFAIR